MNQRQKNKRHNQILSYYRLPLSFYWKLVTIIMISGITLIYHRHYIIATWQNSSYTPLHATTLIAKHIIGLPEQTHVQLSHPTANTIQSSEVPRALDTRVMQSEQYIQAQNVATQFNQQIDLAYLNQLLTQKMNTQRLNNGWQAIVTGDHLQNGAHHRVTELSEYYYLNSTTVEGDDFRVRFPNIENAQYRIGENLLEVYLAGTDIHLTTWHDENILADYLVDALNELVTQTQFENYASQYIAIKAAASDYILNNTAYVRLVVVVEMDIQ